MNKKKVFFVLRSGKYSIIRLILVIIPFIVFLLLNDESHHLESITLFIFLFVLMIFAVISISPIIILSEDGMYCVQWLKKRRFMPWNEIETVGRICQSVGTTFESTPMCFVYFSSVIVKPELHDRHFYAPQLSDDFFFLTDSMRLQLELKNHLKESDYNKIYK